ncbi:MAG: transcription termination/antitermination protein NusA [Thiomargarita sp.]|nr:transcription termination/antitermination protein NusA [Thiomargarita sp.]
MNKEILFVVEMVSNEKGVSKEVIFEALECAIASATKKQHHNNINVRISIDQQTGEYSAFRRWQIVEDGKIESEELQINLTQARKENTQAIIGEWIEQSIETINFNRIGAQTAKQVIVQKIREAERAQIFEAYKNRQGELLSGVVKRVERGNIIVDLGDNAEAVLQREEMIHREIFRPGDRLRGYLKSVNADNRGGQLFLSRTAPELLIKLFSMEVPEIGENLLEIMAAARDPGLRAKIAVCAKDSRIDPVGACVGMRGSRIQAISNELSGERVDIIIWDENPAQFVMNAMSPAEVVSIIVDEETHSMDVAVKEDQLSQAIGRNGQNVRLATELTQWNLNVMTESQATEKHQKETVAALEIFVKELEVDEEIAEILVQEGFASLEEIAYVPLNEMLEIEEFDEDLVKELRSRAKDSLLTREIADEEHIYEKKPSEDLQTMEGMSEQWLEALVKQGILTKEDLAEQSVDDLIAIESIDEKQAGQLIMTARAAWFNN